METTTTPTNPFINPPVEPDTSVAEPVYGVGHPERTPDAQPVVVPTPQAEQYTPAQEIPVALDQGTQQPVDEKGAEPAEEDVVDILVPKAKSVQWKFGPRGTGPNGEGFEFIQRPLSFIGKVQWFSLVGDVLDKALSGENSMSLNGLLSAPGRPGELSMSDFRDADTFVQAIGKLLSVAPDFLVKSYCIWLSVPDWQQDLVGEVMALPVEEGGLSDDQGIEIIETFIDQNYEALDHFFRDLLGRLATRTQQRAQAVASSRQSKR